MSEWVHRQTQASESHFETDVFLIIVGTKCLRGPFDLVWTYNLVAYTDFIPKKCPHNDSTTNVCVFVCMRASAAVQVCL